MLVPTVHTILAVENQLCIYVLLHVKTAQCVERYLENELLWLSMTCTKMIIHNRNQEWQ